MFIRDFCVHRSVIQFLHGESRSEIYEQRFVRWWLQLRKKNKKINFLYVYIFFLRFLFLSDTMLQNRENINLHLHVVNITFSIPYIQVKVHKTEDEVYFYFVYLINKMQFEMLVIKIHFERHFESCISKTL